MSRTCQLQTDTAIDPDCILSGLNSFSDDAVDRGCQAIQLDNSVLQVGHQNFTQLPNYRIAYRYQYLVFVFKNSILHYRCDTLVQYFKPHTRIYYCMIVRVREYFTHFRREYRELRKKIVQYSKVQYTQENRSGASLDTVPVRGMSVFLDSRLDIVL